MRLLSTLFRKPENPGAALARIGRERQRQKVREVCDRMRDNLGMPKADW